MSQPAFTTELLQSSDHLCKPPLDSLQQVHNLVLEDLELQTVVHRRYAKNSKGLPPVGNDITGFLSNVSRSPHRRGERVHRDVHILELAKLGNLGDICLPKLQGFKASEVNPCRQWRTKGVTVVTRLDNLTSLSGRQLELLLQCMRILVEKPMRCLGLREHVRLRGYPRWVSQLVSPCVTFRYKSWQVSGTPYMQNVVWMNSGLNYTPQGLQ
ncbi:hypothetical protein DUI87_03745 [Hirundo rustica rustica]|uniref:Uncharacterized protein n=1 Tax=Hirundo rustica rustica TaxID=333673 RepID=A0A3M0L2B8_HIRRU|nr:hypothetical protein DUI87_03745 [Hirundo rustica rustica]